jgi:hypothetical protein
VTAVTLEKHSTLKATFLLLSLSPSPRRDPRDWHSPCPADRRIRAAGGASHHHWWRARAGRLPAAGARVRPLHPRPGAG